MANANHWWPQAIQKAHAEGMTNASISREVGCSVAAVGYHLTKLGLSSNRPRGTPPDPVDDRHSRCKKCKAVTPNEDFPWVQGRLDGRRLSVCRKCRYRQSREGMSVSSYWSDKQSRIRRNQRGWSYDLPDSYLFDQWEKQKGLCFYTDLEMKIALAQGRDPLQASVDRIDCREGYVVGNVVLCTTKVNLVKRDTTLDEMQLWMPEWYRRVEAYRSIGLTVLQVAPGSF